MTEVSLPQTPPSKGPLAQRPAADGVPPGTTYDATDTGDLWKSDGKQWWDANAERDPWHLAYGEDVAVGWQIRRLAEVPMQGPQQQHVRVGGLVALVAGGGVRALAPA